MITVEETYEDSREAFGWMVDLLHPEWERESGIQMMSEYFPAIKARMFAFYDNGKHVASIATAKGFNLHHGDVLDTFSVVSPDAQGNRALLKAMLAQSKQVCREAGLQVIVRSIHLSNTLTQVRFVYIGGA